MSVYIPSMETPESCSDCKLRTAVGCCGNLPHNTRMPNCPLVPVPPHGRLIDADILLSVIKKERNRIADTYGKNDEFVRCLERYAMSMVSEAPTIIPAEEVPKCSDT